MIFKYGELLMNHSLTNKCGDPKCWFFRPGEKTFNFNNPPVMYLHWLNVHGWQLIQREWLNLNDVIFSISYETGLQCFFSTEVWKRWIHLHNYLESSVEHISERNCICESWFNLAECARWATTKTTCPLTDANMREERVLWILRWHRCRTLSWIKHFL